jgi:predicted MPP superfamily phosphohydrolase
MPAWLKLRSRGRGGRYSPIRGLVESAQAVCYRGDWPARIWSRVPGADHVREIRKTITIPAGEGGPCRLAFLSDLHVGPTTPESVQARAVEIVRAASPDVVLLGGDYVFLEATPPTVERLRGLVASLEAPTKLAVMGNHDLWTDDALVAGALEDAGARILVNESVRLPPPWSDVVVVGLDDPWTGDCDADRAFATVGEGARFRIVLCHSPDGLVSAGRHRFDFYVCGHTHGGQIAAPWGPIVLPKGPMTGRFHSGFARFDSAEVFVSRGVGTVDLPGRLFAEPDVLVLDLRRTR